MKGGLTGKRKGLVVFLVVCGLVAGGLGWVTAAVLRLEEEQLADRLRAEHSERLRLFQREQERSRQARQREREQQEMQARAEFDARLRLALWRLDSRLTPVLAREDTRPYNHYSAVFAPAVVLDSRGNRYAPTAVLEPSPLLSADLPDWMLLHFQTAPESGWGSPQVLVQTQKKQMASNSIALSNVTATRYALLTDLSSAATSHALLERVRRQELQLTVVNEIEAALDNNPTQVTATPGGKVGKLEPPPPAPGGQSKQLQEQQQQLRDGRRDGNYGYPSRVATRVQTTQEVKPGTYNDDAYTVFQNTSNFLAGPWAKPGRPRPSLRDQVVVRMGPMTPFWLPAANGQNRLMVARRVRVSGLLMEKLALLGPWPRSGAPAVLGLLTAAQYKQTRLPVPKEVCQGIVLDWKKLRKLLTDEIRDLFPKARALPMRAEVPPHPERTMTALPVELDPGEEPEEVPPLLDPVGVAPPVAAGLPASLGWTPLRIGLALAWAAALIALAAVGLGGWSLIGLSERRIRFVSAVTHELRTPLTTLRLYLDMLTGGLVRDEERRDEYLHTLNTETDRLTRLVSNVLDFSRLENQRPRLAKERVAVGELLGQVAANWQTRCHDGEKELVIEDQAEAGAAVVTDVSLVQQILGNLIDNACKYSRGADDNRIWLRARVAGPGRLTLEVEDRGPGVPRCERRSIFRAFCRGKSADVTAGGVGLGLALAERWATLIGGRLTLCGSADRPGACFCLELPTAS